jgi:hypothetical protein
MGDINSGMDNPIAGLEPPRSRKKLWIFGGLGCLGMIGLCCVGIFALGYMVGKPMLDFQEENVTLATMSPEVESALGAPITAGPVKPQPNGDGAMKFTAQLDGSKASGTLVFVGKPEGTEWSRQSIHLEVDGEKIDLDPEAIFNFEVDDGQ